jgi:hypothetical protein
MAELAAPAFHQGYRQGIRRKPSVRAVVAPPGSAPRWSCTKARERWISSQRTCAGQTRRRWPRWRPESGRTGSSGRKCGSGIPFEAAGARRRTDEAQGSGLFGREAAGFLEPGQHGRRFPEQLNRALRIAAGLDETLPQVADPRRIGIHSTPPARIQPRPNGCRT